MSPNKSFSINENDYDYNCLEIALQAEAIEILLDAKERSQVRLERNYPPPPKQLGEGQYNVILLTHIRKNETGSIILTPCNQSSKNDLSRFKQYIQSKYIFFGL
jgi:hypothetical protein